MKNLHDIKPVELISFELYELLFIGVVLLLIVVLLFSFYKYSFNQKTSLIPQDFFDKDSKQLLYDFTLFAKQNKDESLEDELHTILTKIEKYKYRKEQIPLEPQVIESMKKYIQKLEENVSNR